jgi:16S rRNA (cytosine1407-C5)-methyltransferase
MARENFTQAMQSMFSSDQEFDAFQASLQKPLKKTIKVLESRMDIEQFQHITSLRGRQLTATHLTQLHDMFYIDRDDTTVALGKTFMHLLGFFYMQELAASIPAHFLDIPQQGVILDMSASPGGKTVQLADYAFSK